MKRQAITSWVQYTVTSKGDLVERSPVLASDDLVELGVGASDIPLFSARYRDVVPRSRCALTRTDIERNIGH